jgi:dolichol kinase
MQKSLATVIAGEVAYKAPSSELTTELVRKGIHLLIAFVPLFASVNIYATLLLLGFGIVVYSWAEKLRCEGKSVFIITRLTDLASRERDRGSYVLGPVTLGLGAMGALFFYPEPAASIAIYALAFGDSFSSIIGKGIGGIQLPFTGGKTASGSMTCLLIVFVVSYLLTGYLGVSLLIAFVATVLEALPLKDMDNIVIPLGTGLAAALLLL